MVNCVYFMQPLQGLKPGPQLLLLASLNPFSPTHPHCFLYSECTHVTRLPLLPRRGRCPLFGAGFPNDPVTLSSGLLRIRGKLISVLTSCLSARSSVLVNQIAIIRISNPPCEPCVCGEGWSGVCVLWVSALTILFHVLKGVITVPLISPRLQVDSAALDFWKWRHRLRG